MATFDYASPHTNALPRAGAWQRILSLCLDLLLIAPVSSVLCAAGSFEADPAHHSVSLPYLLAVVLPLAYSFLLEVLRAETVGMSLVGIRITLRSGASASFRRLLARWFGKYCTF